MNTTKKMLVTLGLVAAACGQAMAGTINFGTLDTVVGVSTNTRSSPAAESAWVSSVLAGNYLITENLSGTGVLVSTGTAGRYAIDLSGLSGSPIGYVLVKNATTFLLLQNNANSDWLYFNWAGELESDEDEEEVEYDLNGRGRNSGQTSISHFALVSPLSPPPSSPAPPVGVPEPAALGLMGLGLVAAGLRRRKAA